MKKDVNVAVHTHGVEGFETWVDFSPSYYMVRSDPAKNYGVSNMRAWFYLKGPKGVIQWQIGTEWGIEQVREHLGQFGFGSHTDTRKPSGWDLGYHSHMPMYDGQEPMSDHCDVLGGQCYYDGSGVQADLLIEGFLAGGTKWLWPKLAEVYQNRFEDGAWPDFTPVYKKHPDDEEKAA